MSTGAAPNGGGAMPSQRVPGPQGMYVGSNPGILPQNMHMQPGAVQVFIVFLINA